MALAFDSNCTLLSKVYTTTKISKEREDKQKNGKLQPYSFPVRRRQNKYLTSPEQGSDFLMSILLDRLIVIFVDPFVKLKLPYCLIHERITIMLCIKSKWG